MDEKGNNNNLESLEKKYIDAGGYGLNLQREGIRIVRNAEKGKEIIEYIKIRDDVRNNPETQSWIAKANASIPSHPPENIAEINKYATTVGSSAASGDVMVRTSGTCSLFQDTIYEGNKAPKFIYVNSYDADWEELDEYLARFSEEFEGIGDFVSMRKGAWEVFSSPVQGNLAMSAHSIREILSKVISKYGSDDAIVSTDWWKNTHQDTDKITQRERLRCLIFGPKKEINESLELVEDTVNACFKAHEKLKKVAHGSSGLKDEVKNAMIVTEQALLAIFRARASNYEQ